MTYVKHFAILIIAIALSGAKMMAQDSFAIKSNLFYDAPVFDTLILLDRGYFGVS